MDFAPGLPSRHIKDVPRISEPQVWNLAIQKHDAKRAGTHFDLRLVDNKNGKAYSWAVRNLPSAPGDKTLAKLQPTHTAEYSTWSGTIESGYGAGNVELFQSDKTEIIKADPEHILFNVYKSNGDTERYALIHTGGDDWLFHNVTVTRETRPQIPTEKPSYKSIDINKVEIENPNQVLAPKIDGALNVFLLRKGKPIETYSYRPSKKNAAKLIDHTYRSNLYKTITPHAFKGNTVLLGEVFARDRQGETLPSTETSARLLSNVWRSRQLQEKGPLDNVVFNILRYQGRDVSNKPYSEKLQLLKRITSSVPGLKMPPLAISPEQKKELVRQIMDKKHPMTSEGVVVYDLNASVPMKAKIQEDYDVHIKDVFPGEGKYKGIAAGGFTYSHTPDGPAVGRVGSGFDDETRKRMWEKPEEWKGQVARVWAQQKLPSGALRMPVFKDVRSELWKKAGLNWGHMAKEYVVPSLVAGPIIGAGITAATSKNKEEFKHDVKKGMGMGIAGDLATGGAMALWNQRKNIGAMLKKASIKDLFIRPLNPKDMKLEFLQSWHQGYTAVDPSETIVKTKDGLRRTRGEDSGYINVAGDGKNNFPSFNEYRRVSDSKNVDANLGRKNITQYPAYRIKKINSNQIVIVSPSKTEIDSAGRSIARSRLYNIKSQPSILERLNKRNIGMALGIGTLATLGAVKLYKNTQEKKAGLIGAMLKKAVAAAKPTLLPYQEQLKQKLQNQHGAVVTWGLGSGKTLGSIAAADQFGDAKAVVPASLRNNFKKELKAFKPKNKFQVESYEKFIRNPDVENKTVIFDEAHRLRTSGSKRSQAAQALSSKAKKAILLTGTPIQNAPHEIAPLINIAAGHHVLPTSEKEFNARYLKRVVDNPGIIRRTLFGAKQRDEYHINNAKDFEARVKPYIVNNTGYQNKDIPKVETHNVDVQMSPSQAKVYKTMETQLPGRVRRRIEKALPADKKDIGRLNAFLSATRQVSNTEDRFYKGQQKAYSPKFDQIVKRVSGSPGKALIYSNYLESGAHPLSEMLTKNNISHGVFTGELGDRERKKMVDAYNKDKIKALIVSSSGGEGLDLKGTRQVHITEPHWNEAKIDQVIGRSARLGSHSHLPEADRKVDVYRYQSVLPERRHGFLWLKKGRPISADQYLDNMSKRKTALNNEFLSIIKRAEQYMSTAPKTQNIYEDVPATMIEETDLKPNASRNPYAFREAMAKKLQQQKGLTMSQNSGKI